MKLAIILCLCFLLSGSKTFADGQNPSELHWEELSKGIEFTKTFLSNPISAINSEVLMIRLDPKIVKLTIADARTFGEKRMTVKKLAQKQGAVVAINANFFGKDHKPLGLVLSNSKELNPLQLGGSVLSGVFYLKGNQPKIVHREQIEAKLKPELALQSGPRIIANSQKLSFKKKNGATRRSGLAVTADGKVILFATRLRFPGARLEEIQKLFLAPELAVTDVLNLDGGSSSQFFISSDIAPKNSEINISGGDRVPVALVIHSAGGQ